MTKLSVPLSYQSMFPGPRTPDPGPRTPDPGPWITGWKSSLSYRLICWLCFIGISGVAQLIRKRSDKPFDENDETLLEVSGKQLASEFRNPKEEWHRFLFSPPRTPTLLCQCIRFCNWTVQTAALFGNPTPLTTTTTTTTANKLIFCVEQRKLWT